MPYHCRAQKAVVVGGMLKDTFWHDGGENALRIEDIDIEYQGNLHEMAEIRDHETNYYRPEDVVDMRHSNSSRATIYVKPGVKRNVDRMREHLDYRIERARAEISSAESLIERLAEAKDLVDAGSLKEVYL